MKFDILTRLAETGSYYKLQTIDFDKLSNIMRFPKEVFATAMSSPIWRYCSSESAAGVEFEVDALTATGAAANAADPKPTFCKKDLLLFFIGFWATIESLS